MWELVQRLDLDWTAESFQSRVVFSSLMVFIAAMASAARVVAGLHTIAQVVVGAVVGSGFSAFYLFNCMPWIRLSLREWDLSWLQNALILGGGSLIALIVLERRAQRRLKRWVFDDKAA